MIVWLMVSTSLRKLGRVGKEHLVKYRVSSDKMAT